jgi:threonine/homoserine/homoserine lactone efflux protein
MPEPSTIVVFALAGLVLVAIPGPNLIYIATRSLSQGRRAGVASALGVGTGTLVHVTAAAVGLSALIASSATAFDAVKYLGAAYLVYLGIRTLTGRDEPAPEESSRPAASLRRTYLEGMVVNLLNPKVGLFFLAFLPQFVDPSRGAATSQILVLGAVLAAIGLCMDMLYAFAAGALGGWLRGRDSFARRQRLVTGGVYIALGATAALVSGGRRSG